MSMKKISFFHACITGGSIIGSFSFFCLFPQVVFADAPVTCNRTAEEFRQNGEITCGHIQWKMYPSHVSILGNDPLSYIKKYEALYTHLAQFTGAEPADKQIVIIEKCPSWRYAQCPNGRMEKPESLYLTSGTNTIVVSEDFFERIFHVLARDSRTPLSVTLFHEMGHAFLPQMQSTGYTLLWDNSSAESFVDLISVFSYLLKNDTQGGMAPLYSDIFCKRKLQIEICGDYMYSLSDMLSLDRGIQQYLQDQDTFDTLFVYPQSQDKLAQRSAKFVGLMGFLAQDGEKRMALYDGLNRAMRFYNLSFFAPEHWKVSFEGQTRDMTVQKTNLFIFLVSAYAKIDYSEQFQKWGFPVMRTVGESISDIRSHGYSEDLIQNYVKKILAENVSNQKLSSNLTNIWIEESASGNTLIIRWTNAPSTYSVTLFRSENEGKFPVSLVKNIVGTEYRDTNLFDGKRYYYRLVGYDMNSHESPISMSITGVPKFVQPVNYGQFSLTAHQIQDVTDKSSLVVWQTNMPAKARLAFGKSPTAMPFSVEAEEFVRQNAFSLSGLTPGTVYYYQLTLADAQGRSIQTTRSFITDTTEQHSQIFKSKKDFLLLKHITIQETGTTNSVKIQWPTEDMLPFVSVRIYRSHSSWERGELLADVSGNTYWYDNTLIPYTQYFYKIAGVTGHGEEFFSNPLVVIIGDVPTIEISSVQVKLHDKKMVSLTWNAPVYFSSCTRVRVYRSIKKGIKGTRVGEGGCSATFFERLDPSSTTRYYYSLIAVNTSKKESRHAHQYEVVVSGRTRAVQKKIAPRSYKKKTLKKQPVKLRIVPSWGYPPAEQI